jgi:hypothetical protein
VKLVRKRVKVFLSHSSKDRRFVKRLTPILGAQHIKYWYSQRHILGAQQWHDEIGRALAKCNWFALALSPASAKSKWVKHELLFALEHKAYKGHILVLSLRSAKFKKLSWTLSQFQWIDFTKGFDLGCKALLRVWSKKRRRP